MLNHTSREVQREAYRVYLRIDKTRRIIEKTLRGEYGAISMESADLMEHLTEACLSPLNHSLPSSESDCPTERLQATLEGIKDTLRHLKKLLTGDLPKSDAEQVESVSDILGRLEQTFLNPDWLSSKTFKNDNVDVTKWGVMFQREGKVVSNIPREVQRDLDKMKSVSKKLQSTVPAYNSKVDAVLNEFMKVSSPQEAVELYNKRAKSLPATPAEQLASERYAFLGYPKGDRFVSTKGPRPVFTWVAIPPNEVTKTSLPPLSAEEAKSLAETAVEFGALMASVTDTLNQHRYYGSFSDLPEAVSDLEEVDEKAWEKIGELLEAQSHYAVSDDGLDLVATFCERMISAIYSYLTASVE